MAAAAALPVNVSVFSCYVIKIKIRIVLKQIFIHIIYQVAEPLNKKEFL